MQPDAIDYKAFERRRVGGYSNQRFAEAMSEAVPSAPPGMRRRLICGQAVDRITPGIEWIIGFFSNLSH
ncbi:hypothetical protein [Micromonospora echinospora]